MQEQDVADRQRAPREARTRTPGPEGFWLATLVGGFGLTCGSRALRMRGWPRAPVPCLRLHGPDGPCLQNRVCQGWGALAVAIFGLAVPAPPGRCSITGCGRCTLAAITAENRALATGRRT